MAKMFVILLCLILSNCDSKEISNKQKTDLKMSTTDSLLEEAKNIAAKQGIDTSLYEVRNTVKSTKAIQINFIMKGTHAGRGWPYHFGILFEEGKKAILFKGS